MPYKRAVTPSKTPLYGKENRATTSKQAHNSTNRERNNIAREIERETLQKQSVPVCGSQRIAGTDILLLNSFRLPEKRMTTS